MPNFPIIDTHLHVWDQTKLRYSAFAGSPLFNHPYHVEDYRRDCGKLDIEAMVFLECYADFWEGGGQYIDEIKFVESEARRDPRIKGIVPMAPLEWGNKVEPMLRQMQNDHPTVKGIRRIVEFDNDPRALTLSDSFIEGVNLLAKFGWHFEITAQYHQMDIVREFVMRIPDVPLILTTAANPASRKVPSRSIVTTLPFWPNARTSGSNCRTCRLRRISPHGPKPNCSRSLQQLWRRSARTAQSLPATTRSCCRRPP